MFHWFAAKPDLLSQTGSTPADDPQVSAEVWPDKPQQTVEGLFVVNEMFRPHSFVVQALKFPEKILKSLLL